MGGTYEAEGVDLPDELSDALRTVERIVEQLATEQPIVALTVIAQLERLTVDQAPRAGIAARQKGTTWDAIGRAIGATRQAAFQRFGRHLPAVTASTPPAAPTPAPAEPKPPAPKAPAPVRAAPTRPPAPVVPAPVPAAAEPPAKPTPARPRKRLTKKAALALVDSAQLVKDANHRDTGTWHLVAEDGTVIAHVEPSYGGASRSGRNGWHGWPHGMMRTTERKPTRELAAQYAAAAWVRVATAPARTED